ncbi:MAG: transketolase family protein [Propionibacteriaceae bacterium]|jgi:transketolase|nr:transketolase family protein [Propionibacteriaceae bacterium]
MSEQIFRDPRKTFGAAVSAIASEDPRIVILSADSGKSSGFTQFAAEFPERYFELGIMEQGVVGVASGLATTGKIPVFCAIAPFTTARPFEMVRNDVGYMRQNVKIVGRNAGISYSDLGATHHSLEDFAIMRMIPGMTIIAPQDPSEIETAAAAMLAHDGPVYLRIGNDPIPELFEPTPFTIGKARTAREGSDLTIVATGNLTRAALEAAELLSAQGVSAEVIGMPTVWPIDAATLRASAAKTGRVFTVEEHYVVGGLGTIVQEVLSGQPIPVTKLGIPHEYATSGPYMEILAHYGLDANGIAKAVQQ